jgi:dienelactone hydrolase
MLRRALLMALAATLLAVPGLFAQGPDKKTEVITPKEALVLPPAGQGGRSPVHTDAVEAEMVAGLWKAPRAGDAVNLPDGKQAKWQALAVNAKGLFTANALRGGYAYFNVPSDAERVMMLEAAGHAMMYVNGEPRAGDMYSHGYLHVPVLLKKGDNHFLFQVARGQLQWRLTTPPKDVYILPHDMRLPDALGPLPDFAIGTVVVVNATRKPQQGLGITVGVHNWKQYDLPPMSIRKVAVLVPLKDDPKTGKVPCELALVQNKAGDKPAVHDSFQTELHPRKFDEPHVRTFMSDIDGSVQYYAVTPAHPGKKDTLPALFLSLHGASVEATGQAAAYAAKTWGHLIAATNRRPYGFDWEDWGRLDAMEVLEHAQKLYKTDPQRTYLTGHSMGGHGTWHVGATYPDRFAAIGPSAGWVSFWTYAGGKRPDPATPIQGLLRRATNPSDTVALAKNYLHHGVYVLHGDADDNVPVGQARMMKKLLEPFHKDFHYFEQPKAGHWWSNTDEPGAACVDWAPMFDMFARHVIPRKDQVREIGFITANPGVSAWCHWVGIEAQVKQMEFSSVQIRCDPVKRRFIGTTDNVARLALDLGHLAPDKDLAVELDGHKLAKVDWPKGGKLWLARSGKEWKVITQPPSGEKGAHRYGPFRDAFRHRFMLVYGTRGNAEENAWAYAKARLDAETWWYRANGSVDVVADVDFDANKERDRGVILYGNADTNAAWKPLLGDSPVQVKSAAVTVGPRTEKGDDLACLFLRPRPGSEVACVAAISGTGVKGMRLTDRLPIFISGVGYPDCIVLGPEMLSKGYDGVRAAGYFGLDWTVDNGEFAWHDAKAEK